MPRLIPVLLLLFLALSDTPGGTVFLQAQETESPMSPAGRLRVEIAPSFTSWDSRFGLRTEDGRTVEGTEPLGFDLSREDASVWFPEVASLEEALTDLLEDPGYMAMLGSTRAHVTADRVRLPVRLDLGVMEWLTVGVTVPFVKTRTELAVTWDSAGADLGLAPGAAAVDAWLTDLGSTTEAAAQQAQDVCDANPGSGECMDALALAVSLESFHEDLAGVYGVSAFFPAEDSDAAEALLERSALLAERAQTAGLGAFDPDLPLGQRLGSVAELDELLRQRYGEPGFADRVGLWELGDVEVHAVLRLLEGVRRNDAGDATLRYQVGVGGLVRLGTGTVDAPLVPLDQGAGDGQTDLEGRIFSNLTWRRLGLWTDLRRGIQMSTTLERSVAPPEQVFRDPASLATVEWTPGDYTSLEVAPRFHLTDELAVSGGYRFWSKAEDRYEGPPVDGVDPSILDRETEQTLHQLGLALVFNTLDAWREGRTSLPFEARFSVRRAVAGSGGRTPKTFRTGLGLRVYHRFWGR